MTVPLTGFLVIDNEIIRYICNYQVITGIKVVLRHTIVIIAAVWLNIGNSLAQIYGCTDPQALNYNSSATVNDGSCNYPLTSVTPETSMNLVNTLDETSGLILWNKRLWTHNDSEDLNIYALDTINGNILQSVQLTGTVNKDWEEISHDKDYIYIGDFGNNSGGNRTDLKILKISKNSISAGQPVIETINFSYADQTDFTPAAPNTTDFDCEAFIVSSDSIYLFTKQWTSLKTTVYSLPKITGTYIAKKRSTYNIEGLVTGATFLESKRLIVLCGYSYSDDFSTIPEPFVYLLYDFNKSGFFSGNKRKLSVSLPFHQIEGIATVDGLKYFASNEYFSYPPFLSISQKMHVFNFSAYLDQYLQSVTSVEQEPEEVDNCIVYPVPADDYIYVSRRNESHETEYTLINMWGQPALAGMLNGEENRINLTDLPSGIYYLKIGSQAVRNIKVIKI